MAFVIDASITAAWLIPDEATPATDAILGRLRGEGAVVPVIWPLEVTNLLITSERRGRIAEAQTTHLISAVADLPVTVDTDGMSRTFHSVPALARAHQLSSYDASYLELAMRLGLPMATLDKDLAKAATSVGVQLIS